MEGVQVDGMSHDTTQPICFKDLSTLCIILVHRKSYIWWIEQVADGSMRRIYCPVSETNGCPNFSHYQYFLTLWMLLREAVGGGISNTKVSQKRKGWMDQAEIPGVCEISDPPPTPMSGNYMLGTWNGSDHVRSPKHPHVVFWEGEHQVLMSLSIINQESKKSAPTDMTTV